MSIQTSTAGAVELDSGKWIAVISFYGDGWKQIGSREFDTGDEAMDVAWACVERFVDMVGARVIHRGVETYTACPDGVVPAPVRFAPEMN